MNIGIDVMGGDHAPESTVKGALLALDALPREVSLSLIGDENKISPLLNQSNPRIKIIHAEDHIEMGENPVKAMSNKPHSSIGIGFHLLEKGEINGFAGAGNTGAMLIGAMYSIKSIPGIIRPVITATIPQETGPPKILLDVGINPDCKPDVLYQWAILGSLYAKDVHKIENPEVGLLNIGSEEEKGNLLTKNTFQLMKGTKDFLFTGNVEGDDIFAPDKADIIVCDGFVGNIVLKQAEAFYALIKRRKKSDDFIERFNFENYGGTPVLGVNKSVIIGHGISNEIAIKNMILLTKEVAEAQLAEKIRKAFN